MYSKTVIRFRFFFYIQNNQGLGKGYQPQSSASAENPYLGIDYSEKAHLLIVYNLVYAIPDTYGLISYFCKLLVKLKSNTFSAILLSNQRNRSCSEE